MSINQSAAQAREGARQRTGEFGEQQHSAPEMTLGGGEVDLTTQAPVDIDTQLADIYEEIARLRAPMQWRQQDAERKRADVERAEENGERYEGQLDYLTRAAEEAEGKLSEMQGAVDAKAFEALPLEREFRRRGGWPRAYLATSAGGHVHRHTQCSTCNNGTSPTRFAWLVDYSGMDDETIINAAGSDCCTTCWKDAPTDALNRPRTMFSKDEKQKQADREAREQKRIEAAQKKIANALTADGSEFVVQVEPENPERRRRLTESFKTERAALIWASDVIAWRYPGEERNERDDVRDAAIRTIAEAVAAKHSRPVEFVIGEIRVKGEVKAQRMTASEGKKAIAALAAEHGVTL